MKGVFGSTVTLRAAQEKVYFILKNKSLFT